MGWLDKLLGRAKKAAGDGNGNEGRRQEGLHQEREGRAGAAEEEAQAAPEQAAEHRAERET